MFSEDKLFRILGNQCHTILTNLSYEQLHYIPPPETNRCTA